MSFEEDKQRLLSKSAALVGEERYEENEDLLRDALDRFPDEPEVILTVAASKMYKDPERAQELIGEALEIEPADSHLLLRAGIQMLYMEKYKEASQLAQRAADNVTDDFNRWGGLAFLMGKLFLVAGHDEDAEECLRDAFELEPDTHPHGLELAELFARSGRYEEAMAVLDEALTHLPDERDLLAMREKLQEARRS